MTMNEIIEIDDKKSRGITEKSRQVRIRRQVKNLVRRTLPRSESRWAEMGVLFFAVVFVSDDLAKEPEFSSSWIFYLFDVARSFTH